MHIHVRRIEIQMLSQTRQNTSIGSSSPRDIANAIAMRKANVAIGRLYSGLLKKAKRHLRQVEQQEKSDDIFGGGCYLPIRMI
jgi:hypothetical protein